MAITVNGAILRNMPEQISKNVEDIADLQTASTDHESRISDLENDIISSITFNNMSTTGDTVLGDAAADSTTIHGTLQHTDGNAEFGGNVEIDGTLTVNSAADLNNDLDVAGDVNVSGDLDVIGSLTRNGISIVKTIYIHPITILLGGDNEAGGSRLTMLIFSNSSSSLGTIYDLSNYLISLYNTINTTVRIMTSGSYYDTDNSELIIASFLGYNGSIFFIAGTNTSGVNKTVAKSSLSDLLPNLSSMYDAVNAIN